MAEILVGTSGYDYAEWREVFYPPETPRGEFLEFYARAFPTVELNFSYYTLPSARRLEDMVRRTPPGFDFSIKAFRGMTHEADPDSWKETTARYRRALYPLEKAGRLGAVLLQFPSSFRYEPERRRYLDRLVAELRGLPLVAEFRGGAWQNTRVYDALRERGVGLCVTDMPDLPGLPQASDVVTADTGYIRFHGRNAGTWWSGDAAGRYDYLYSEEELAEWERRIRCMRELVRVLRIYFNNHRGGQAVVNAGMLKKLLGPPP